MRRCVFRARPSDNAMIAHPLPPPCQRRAIKWQPMLEELLPTEELEIGILDPAVTQRLITQVVHVLEKRQACHQRVSPTTKVCSVHPIASRTFIIVNAPFYFYRSQNVLP